MLALKVRGLVLPVRGLRQVQQAAGGCVRGLSELRAVAAAGGCKRIGVALAGCVLCVFVPMHAHVSTSCSTSFCNFLPCLSASLLPAHPTPPLNDSAIFILRLSSRLTRVALRLCPCVIPGQSAAVALEAKLAGERGMGADKVPHVTYHMSHMI